MRPSCIIGFDTCNHDMVQAELSYLKNGNAGWLDICGQGIINKFNDLPDYNPYTCTTGNPTCSTKNMNITELDYCQMARYLATDFSLEIIFSCLNAFAWLMLIIWVHRQNDD